MLRTETWHFLVAHVLPASKTGALFFFWEHEMNRSEEWELVFRLMQLEPLNADHVDQYQSNNIYHLAGQCKFCAASM
jgi:hypothetical protein